MDEHGNNTQDINLAVDRLKNLLSSHSSSNIKTFFLILYRFLHENEAS